MDILNFVPFRHCPRCGQAALKVKDVKSCLCTACGFQYYHNPACAVSGIIESDGRVLIIQRARDPERGQWAFPGGFVDYHESLEAALEREIREELGLEVTGKTYLCSQWDEYHYRDVIYQIVICYFVVQVRALHLARAGDDAACFTLTEPKEIDPTRLAFRCNAAALNTYLEYRKARQS